MIKISKVLITGGAGFIGSHTADLLASKGFKVRILDELLPPVHKKGVWPNYVKNKGYELIKGDVSKKSTWVKALKDIDYVYHLAAYQDQREDFGNFFVTNTVSTALLYETIVEKNLPIKKVVLASSQFVYGDGQYKQGSKTAYPELRTLAQLKAKKWDIKGEFIPFKENQVVNPTNSYGLSKVALEKLSLRLGKTYGVPTTIMRYSIVQGPRQSPRNMYSGALRIFTVQALLGEALTVFEDGKQTRDFVNVADVAKANHLVLKNKKADFQIFNVGGGKAYEVLDFAKWVVEISKSDTPIIIGNFRRTDTRHAVSNISKLKKLGWKPGITPKKSIKDYLDWIKKNKLKKQLTKGTGQRLEKEGVVQS